MKARGFTLVEILVALAIIAVLTAILLPVFNRVRENGRLTSCKSNLHQIGLALQQYTSDNGGIYPRACYTSNDSYWLPGTPIKGKWSDVLQPYLKSGQVFNCLSHSQRYTDSWSSPLYTGDYFYQWGGRTDGKRILSEAQEMRISNPERTVLVCDAGWYARDAETGVITPYYVQQVDNEHLSSAVYFYNAHSGGANFVFADGHVKWLSAQQQVKAPWYIQGLTL